MIYTLDQLAERVRPVCEKYNIPRLWVFGSYARGEATEESDVDLLVDRTDARLSGLFAYGGMSRDFELAIGKPIDFITTKAIEEDLELNENTNFIAHVLSERKQLYANLKKRR